MLFFYLLQMECKMFKYKSNILKIGIIMVIKDRYICAVHIYTQTQQHMQVKLKNPQFIMG